MLILRAKKELLYATGAVGRFFIYLVFITQAFVVISSHATVSKESESQTVLFDNLPRVALLVKEQYVDPTRIRPDAMLASILESLESRITKLVVHLPKSLETALEESRATEDKPKADGNIKEKPEVLPSKTPEKLILNFGGVKKTFDYEPQRSIWGVIFFLRDIFKFVEAEAKKQGLTKAVRPHEEPIDWKKLKIAAINGMLAPLDPHSQYIENSNDLTVTTKGEFGGIGIVISIRDGFLTVISPIDGTPAALAGVKAKDRIVKIDDDSAINMDLNEAVNILRGKPDTKIRITVQRQNSPKEIEFTLKRANIKVDSVAYALLDNNIGYLRIKAFQGNTASDVRNGILAMKKKSNGQMNGLVLDLRGNPGGLLREAVEVSSLFLDGGEVVSTQGARPESRQVEMASGGELDPSLKLVVLADGGSASASEIVAGAIKDGGLKNGRGIVVGERTFGKGSVQMLYDLPAFDDGAEKDSKQTKESKEKPQPAALKLTIAEYFGPNNKSMQNIGVGPDINLSPVRVNKREEISVFPEITMREVDLEGHLSPERSLERNNDDKPLVHLEYLAPNEDKDAQEYAKLDVANLKKDFAVVVASDFIRKSKGTSRQELLANASSIKDQLQTQEQKKITEALKKYNIEWSTGKTETKSGLVAAIAENKGASSGNKLKITVKAKNTSKEPMYQVHGITHSKTPLFDQKEFLFGKLSPGQEIERSIEFEIPKDVVSRKDLLTVEMRDYRREKMGELDIPLDIRGLNRPRFAHMVYVDDSKSGNGDGQVQNGEDVELTVWLKNIGEGKAFEPTVLLRNESGTKIFLKNGRWQSSELLPKSETSMKFAFRVKEPTDKAEFEIQIFDGQMHDIWRDKISINVLESQATKAINRPVMTKQSTAITATPDVTGKKIATVKTGLKLDAIKEIKDYFLVKVDTNLVGFIKKSDVKEVQPKSQSIKKKSDFYTINYDRIPAHIALKFGDKSGWSKSGSGEIYAEINHQDPLSGLLLYVNGKKVLYKDISNKTGTEKLLHPINLKPGINVISLFAREDATYGQRENITVFYDKDGKVLHSPEKGEKAAKVN